MGKIRPLTASWFVQTWLLPELRSLPSEKLYFLLGHVISQQKLRLRKDFIRKSFGILLLWNQSEWSNNTFIYICTIAILHLLLLPLWFKTHGRKYQLKLLLIRLLVVLCSAQWQVHFFSVIWRCSCSSLAGKNKPALVAASYKSKTSQWLEERIVLNVPHPWVEAGEDWRVLCWAGGRERFSAKLLKVSQADQHVAMKSLSKRSVPRLQLMFSGTRK